MHVVREVAPVDRPERRRAGDDRIVAIVNALNAHHRFRPLVRVVARPFAERPFDRRLFALGRNHAFDNDLRLCRHRQFRQRQLDNIHRTAAIGAGELVLRSPERRRHRRRHPGYRLAAEHDGHRRRFASLPIFLRENAPVLLRIDPQTDAIAPLNHRAVTAHVYPTLFGIAHDNHILRADVAPAVAGMPARRGKALDIDIVALLHVGEHRSVFHNFRRDRHRARALIAPAAQQFKG